jgi:hypothetical protein
MTVGVVFYLSDLLGDDDTYSKAARKDRERRKCRVGLRGEEEWFVEAGRKNQIL